MVALESSTVRAMTTLTDQSKRKGSRTASRAARAHAEATGRIAPKKKKKKADGAPRYTAKTADRHELYELSVQDPESECDLIDQVWKEQRGRPCETIREDFCGTAVVCMEWAKRRRANRATGVDLDAEVLGWGKAKMPSRLNAEQASRVELRREDVRTVSIDPVDSVLAMNFSYYLFRTREEMRTYFASVREGLKEDGLFLLDAYGGSESFSEIEEERECEGFTYVWEQRTYHPVTGEAQNAIHFTFPDGSEMRDAFRYDWRLWTLPEIRELLIEAGFRDVVVYWEGEDEESGEGNGEWAVTATGEACPGWIAYLVAVK